MTLTKRGPRRQELNDSSLQELALRYVGKYATTRSKLRSYLSRKIRERGWKDGTAPDLDALINRLAKLGYVDDAAYALNTSRSLSARGYGKQRLTQKLRLDGVEEDDRTAADAHADAQSVAAALRFAKRRGLGPFAHAAPDHRQREKWIATMVRAGHGFGLARTIAGLAPGAPFDLEALSDQLDRTEINID
ncbi:MAG TPA: RecX family transcriptional regulator [Sphingomicrobium sp.]|nr:RecX family transcriptional regulator [Sphingomicrobium sp.]